MEQAYIWIAEEIRLAVAPVFLLTAIATILTLFSSRMGRIADRLDTRADDAPQTATPVLLRRLRLVQWAILTAVAAGLAVCAVVVLIFLSDTVLGDLSGAIATLFILAMALVSVALLLFLAEVSYAAARVSRDLSD